MFLLHVPFAFACPLYSRKHVKIINSGRAMNCSRVVFIFASVILFFLFIGLSSSTEMEESDSSSSSGDCDNPTLTSMFKGQHRQKRAAPIRVIGCQEDNDGSPKITIECDPGSTIRITKGVCVRVTACTAFDLSIENECDNSDKTAQWAPYCATVNPCTVSVSCSAGATCLGDYTYGYADYECVTDETTVPTTLTSASRETPTEERTPTPSVRGETTVPTRSTSGTPETPTEKRTPTPGVRGETTVPTRSTSATPETPTEDRTPTPDFTTIHQALPTLPSQADIVHQKTSLFKRIEGRRLQNHVIKTKHGLSLVKCGAECNKRDDCVSFNIGNGVCELNKQVVGGPGVSRNDFVEYDEFKYYEKQ